MTQISNIIDINLYPAILRPNEHKEFFETQRKLFREQGLLSLPDFILPEALTELVKESSILAEQGYFNSLTGNAYLEKESDEWPEGHPKRMHETTLLGVVAYDQFPNDSLLRTIYEDEDFQNFIEKILNRGPLHKYDCELGALNLSVMKAGHYLRWHFDQSDFVVSLNIQEAQNGGVYEYSSNLRSEKEPNYEGVKKVLQGDRSKVDVLSTPPGSLILFEGRYTLHRVTEIGGTLNRYTGLFGYGLEEGIRSSDYLKEIRYGRNK